jgi:tripartite-type tricarboxylate transporter receptor subunit TctC
MFAPYQMLLGEQVKAGELREFGTATRMRIETLPDVPTVALSGYMDYEADFWDGVVVPAKTPKDLIADIAARFARALREPEI